MAALPPPRAPMPSAVDGRLTGLERDVHHMSGEIAATKQAVAVVAGNQERFASSLTTLSERVGQISDVLWKVGVPVILILFSALVAYIVKN